MTDDLITPGSNMTHFTLHALRAAFASLPSYDDRPHHPVVLPPHLYDRAEHEGFNMTGYVRGSDRVGEITPKMTPGQLARAPKIDTGARYWAKQSHLSLYDDN